MLQLLKVYANMEEASLRPSRCDRGEYWKGSRTEWSRAGPVVVEKKTESRPSVTTACLSGAACLQLRWNQGEICAALIMSLG